MRGWIAIVLVQARRPAPTGTVYLHNGQQPELHSELAASAVLPNTARIAIVAPRIVAFIVCSFREVDDSPSATQ